MLGHYVHGRELDSYAAAGRISQVLLLFLTSVSLIFSPFAADLHARGEIDHLNRLFKDATRWALAATLPVLVVLFVAAPQALDAFGPTYGSGVRPLRIMLAGQLVNVATGSVADVLVMIGSTGLDLVDNLLANVVLIGGAAVLASAYGPTGAADRVGRRALGGEPRPRRAGAAGRVDPSLQPQPAAVGAADRRLPGRRTGRARSACRAAPGGPRWR